MAQNRRKSLFRAGEHSLSQIDSSKVSYINIYDKFGKKEIATS